MTELVICSRCEVRLDNIESGTAESLREEKSAQGFDARLENCLQICARKDVIEGVNVLLNDRPATVYWDEEENRKTRKY